MIGSTVVLLLSCISLAQSPGQTADIVLVHAHIYTFLDGSFSFRQVSLDDAKTIAEIQQRVKTYAAAHPKEPWVLGRGWMYPVFPLSGLPDKKYHIDF